MRKQKELPFIQELLVTLAGDLLEGFEWSRDMHKMTMLTASEWYRLRRKQSRRQFEKSFRDALWRLKRQQCITTREQGNKLMVALTPKGCRRALREKLRRSERLPEGNFVLVFFDIPESEKNARELFRRILKESGFWQLQKSVWASDRAVFEHVQRFIKEYNVEEWMTVCATSKLFGTFLRK